MSLLKYYEEILERAMDWASSHYPNQSMHHKAAFANSVAYLVTGVSGGYGGPSLREHLVSWSLTPNLPPVGEWQFESAVQFAAPLCFGAAQLYASQLRQIKEHEYSFDDDPMDLEAL